MKITYQIPTMNSFKSLFCYPSFRTLKIPKLKPSCTCTRKGEAECSVAIRCLFTGSLAKHILSKHRLSKHRLSGRSGFHTYLPLQYPSDYTDLFKQSWNELKEKKASSPEEKPPEVVEDVVYVEDITDEVSYNKDTPHYEELSETTYQYIHSSIHEDRAQSNNMDETLDEPLDQTPDFFESYNSIIKPLSPAPDVKPASPAPDAKLASPALDVEPTSNLVDEISPANPAPELTSNVVSDVKSSVIPPVETAVDLAGIPAPDVELASNVTPDPSVISPVETAVDSASNLDKTVDPDDDEYSLSKDHDVALKIISSLRCKTKVRESFSLPSPESFSAGPSTPPVSPLLACASSIMD